MQALRLGKRLGLIQRLERGIEIIGDAHAGGEADQRPAARQIVAGEATVPEWATQATAAYLSGQKAARDVLDELV